MIVFNRIDRYLARLITVPLLASLTIAAMLLLLDRMLRLFEFVMSEGGPVSVVWRMLGNLLPEYLSLGIPIGVLMGILMAFRKLATSSELDAVRAVGISYNRLLRVPFVFATVFALVNVGIVGFLQPVSRYAYENLRFELRSGALGASIKVGEFASLGKGMTMRVEESHAQGADLRGLFVRAEGKDGQSLAVTAEQGTFLSTDDPDVILLRLKHGTLVHVASATSVPRVLSFDQHDLPVNLPAMTNFRKRGEGNLERTLPELGRTLVNPAATPEARRDAAANLQPAPGAVSGDVRAAVPRCRARGAAETLVVGARHLPQPDHADHLPQADRIWRAHGLARTGRSGAVAVGAVRAVCRPVGVALLCAGVSNPAASRSARSTGGSARSARGWRDWRAS